MMPWHFAAIVHGVRIALASGSDQRTSSRTLLATLVILCSLNSLWRLQSPNHYRAFGYTFGYRHQFG